MSGVAPNPAEAPPPPGSMSGGRAAGGSAPSPTAPPTSASSKAKPRELTAHPLADIFPPVVYGDDFQAFAKDIEVNGQRDPIVTLSDQILDGRRRYEACRLLQR
jgi:hypothetical protein